MTYTFTLNLTDVFGLSTAILAFAYYFDNDYTKSSVVLGLLFSCKIYKSDISSVHVIHV